MLVLGEHASAEEESLDRASGNGQIVARNRERSVLSRILINDVDSGKEGLESEDAFNREGDRGCGRRSPFCRGVREKGMLFLMRRW